MRYMYTYIRNDATGEIRASTLQVTTQEVTTQNTVFYRKVFNSQVLAYSNCNFLFSAVTSSKNSLLKRKKKGRKRKKEQKYLKYLILIGLMKATVGNKHSENEGL